MNQSAHDEAMELLPWHANGTLEGDESERVAEHMRSCVACRRELDFLGRVATEMEASDGEVLSPGRGFGRLIDQLESETAAARDPGRGRFPRRAVPWLATAAAAVIVLVLVIGRPTEQSTGSGYRTLASPGAAAIPAGEARLRVLFSEATTEREIRQLLYEVGGEIVAGPSELGLYTLEMPAAEGAKAISDVLDRLRQDPRVRFAEITGIGKSE